MPSPTGEAMTLATTDPWASLNELERREATRLWEFVWPSEGGTDKRLQKLSETYRRLDDHRVHRVSVNQQLVAIARTFRHVVGLDGRDTDIVALASVCTHPDVRGDGHGDAVVRASFAHVAELAIPALFQTPVPDFYARFGSRTIPNPITSSTPGAELFDDPWVMIHPGDATWDDDAVVDLRGSGW